jgi:hypothetical protein
MLAVAAPSAYFSGETTLPTMHPLRSLLSLLLPLALGCIVEAPGGDKQAAAGASAPRAGIRPGQVKNGANFDGKVELVGATFAPSALVPGDVTQVKLFFRVLEPLSEDWQVFVHAEDPERRDVRTNFDHLPVGGRRPTSGWKPGEIVEDAFAISLPVGTRQRAMDLWVGFWLPRTDARLPVKNPEALPRVDGDRVLLARLPVQL